MLRQGIRPDVVLTTAQYGHWATPFAKDLGIPNMNQIQQALIEYTEALGSTSDRIKVKVYKVEE